MRSLSWVLGIAAFLLNPNMACSSADSDYQYDAEELRAAVEGTWSLSITDGTGDARSLTLHIEQKMESTALRSPPSSMQPARHATSSLIRPAHACGTRTLIASADACIDATEMPLEVSFVSGEAEFEVAPLSGMFRVDSLIFTSGTLGLTLGELNISAEVNPDGSVTSTQVYAPQGTSISLTREAL